MARSHKGRQRRDWRRTAFYIISVTIVLTMLISLIAVALTPATP